MIIKPIFAVIAVSVVSTTPSWAETIGSGAPLMSAEASAGTMVVVGEEAFYDPDEGAPFDAAPADPFYSVVGGAPEISYTPEGYMVSAEVIDGIRYETMMDHSGRIIEARQVAPTQ